MVTVGDVFKLYNLMNVGKAKFTEDETGELTKRLKRAMKVDTSNPLKECVGLVDRNCVQVHAFVQSCSQRSFDEFLNLGLLLDLRKATGASIGTMLANEHLVGRLLRFYMFGEPLMEPKGEILEFEEPKTFVEVLTEHYDFTKNFYARFCHQLLTRKLKKSQEERLEEYEFVISSLEGVPDNYPIFALRALRIRSWMTNRSVNMLYWMLRDRKDIESHDKYKLQVKKTGKTNTKLEFQRYHYKYDYMYSKPARKLGTKDLYNEYLESISYETDNRAFNNSEYYNDEYYEDEHYDDEYYDEEYYYECGYDENMHVDHEHDNTET